MGGLVGFLRGGNQIPERVRRESFGRGASGKLRDMIVVRTMKMNQRDSDLKAVLMMSGGVVGTIINTDKRGRRTDGVTLCRDRAIIGQRL